MAGKSDKAVFYNLLNLFYDKMRDLETYIKMLEMIESRLKQKHWESPETQKVVKEFKEFCRKKLQYEPDEENIRALIESRYQLSRHLQNVRDILRQIRELQKFVYKWRSAGKKIIDLIPFMEDIKIAKRTDLSQADAEEIISSFAEGKNAMMHLMDFLAELKSHHKHVFFGKIIDSYIDFFKAMDSFFGKMEKYARDIVNGWKKVDSTGLGSALGERRVIFNNLDYYLKQ